MAEEESHMILILKDSTATLEGEFQMVNCCLIQSSSPHRYLIKTLK